MNNTDNLKSIEPEFSTVTVLQQKIWDLDYSLKKITADYHSFHCDLSWTRYGEVEMLKKSILEVQDHLKTISEKITKGEKN